MSVLLIRLPYAMGWTCSARLRARSDARIIIVTAAGDTGTCPGPGRRRRLPPAAVRAGRAAARIPGRARRVRPGGSAAARAPRRRLAPRGDPCRAASARTPKEADILECLMTRPGDDPQEFW